MKLMFCCGSMRKGGAERVIASLSNEFIKKNDVSIVTTIVCEYAYDIDSKINKYSLDDNKTSKNFISKNIFRIKKLINIIKKESPDIIISFLPEPSYRVLFANIFLKKKVIVSVRNDPNREYNSFFKKLLVKILYKKANGFVFQTEDAKNWFSKDIQDKSIVIPNPINSEFVCKPFAGEREKSIVTVGRLNSQKNQKLLISAFSKISSEYPEYILKIYGDGNLKEELVSYTKELNISDKVKFMGNSNNIKNDIYKTSLFVLSSDYEGMPNALMEAMSLGLPCISTDCPCGGPKMLIENEVNGILVKVNDIEDMENAIKKVLKDKKYAKILGDNANKINQKYDILTISNIWEKYIKNILNK